MTRVPRERIYRLNRLRLFSEIDEDEDEFVLCAGGSDEPKQADVTVK